MRASVGSHRLRVVDRRSFLEAPRKAASRGPLEAAGWSRGVIPQPRTECSSHWLEEGRICRSKDECQEARGGNGSERDLEWPITFLTLSTVPHLSWVEAAARRCVDAESWTWSLGAVLHAALAAAAAGKGRWRSREEGETGGHCCLRSCYC